MSNLHDTQWQFIRYILSGFIAVSVHFAVLVVLVESGEFPKTLASVVGFLCAVPVNYLTQYHHVFRAAGSHANTFGRYIAVTLATLAVNAGLFWFLAQIAQINYLVAQGITLGVVVIINFVLNRNFTFSAGPA